MHFLHSVRSLSLLLIAGTIAGCATTGKPADSVVLVPDRSTVDFYNGDGSGVTSWQEVVQDMASSSVVLIGEIHRHEKGLAVAAGLWEDILADAPKAVLSMEFYERDQQLGLDDYLTGVSDRAAFEKATHRTETNNPPGHERLIELAKAANGKVIAANSPRRYSNIANAKGYDALRELDALQQTMFNIPDSLPTGSYAKRFRSGMANMMSAHGDENAKKDGELSDGAKKMIEGLLRAQTLWDHTMAASITTGLAVGAPVFHVVGGFHADYGTEPGGSGLVDALRPDLDPDDRIVILMIVDETPRELTDDELGRGNYVVFVGD